jgi:hypothetical protein
MPSDDNRRDGTTQAMREYRSFLDYRSRPARIDHELRTAERALTNAADLIELHKADETRARQYAKIVRDYGDEVRNWWGPR